MKKLISLFVALFLLLSLSQIAAAGIVQNKQAGISIFAPQGWFIMRPATQNKIKKVMAGLFDKKPSVNNVTPTILFALKNPKSAISITALSVPKKQVRSKTAKAAMAFIKSKVQQSGMVSVKVSPLSSVKVGGVNFVKMTVTISAFFRKNIEEDYMAIKNKHFIFVSLAYPSENEKAQGNKVLKSIRFK